MLENRGYYSIGVSALSTNQTFILFKNDNNPDNIIIVSYLPILDGKTVPSVAQMIELIELMIGSDNESLLIENESLTSSSKKEKLLFRKKQTIAVGLLTHAIIISDVLPAHDLMKIINNPNTELAQMIENQVNNPKKAKKFSTTIIENFQSLLDEDNNLTKRFIFEHFLSKQLYVNLIDHRFVPVHVRLSDNELELLRSTIVLKSEYNLKDVLPKLYTNEPISRYYFYQPGDIIKIIRSIPNRSITYRVVIQPLNNFSKEREEISKEIE